MVNLTAVIAIVVVFLVLAVAYGFTMLRKSGKITFNLEDVLNISQLFGIGYSVMDEIGLLDDEKAKTVADVVELSLEFAEKNLADKPNLIEACEDFAFGLCDEFKIELNDNRRELMMKLINIGLSQIGLITVFGDVVKTDAVETVAPVVVQIEENPSLVKQPIGVHAF